MWCLSYRNFGLGIFMILFFRGWILIKNNNKLYEVIFIR